MKFNIFGTNDIKALPKGTVEERFEHLKKEVSEKLPFYASKMLLTYKPGPRLLEDEFIKSKKEQYASQDVIDFLVNEEEMFIRSPRYMQFFKSQSFTDRKSYNPSEIPRPMQDMFKKQNSDPRVLYEVYYLGCLKPIDNVVADLVKGGDKSLSKNRAYEICEDPNIEMLNDNIFRKAADFIGEKLF